MTNNAIEELIKEVDQVRRSVRNGPGAQIQSEHELKKMRALCTQFFQEVVRFPEVDDVATAKEIFAEIFAAARVKPSRTKVADRLAAARRSLVKLESAVLALGASKAAGRRTDADRLIIDTLTEICPSAANAYAQALADLATDGRLSWRGPATDLREAMRETLDVLAPDEIVMNEPGFKLEKEAHRPTMKQKVRFVLKKRETPHGAMAAPETAVQGVEDMLGGIARSVYNRSSISTHTASSRNEVVRVHAWVRLVLCDLLEIPPD